MTGTTQSRVRLESTTHPLRAGCVWNPRRWPRPAMTSIVVNCNWTSATALVTSTPQCHHICFTTCLPPLPRDLSSIVTSAAVSIMLNLRSKTKWHWAKACATRQSSLNRITRRCHAAIQIARRHRQRLERGAGGNRDRPGVLCGRLSGRRSVRRVVDGGSRRGVRDAHVLRPGVGARRRIEGRQGRYIARIRQMIPSQDLLDRRQPACAAREPDVRRVASGRGWNIDGELRGEVLGAVRRIHNLQSQERIVVYEARSQHIAAMQVDTRRCQVDGGHEWVLAVCVYARRVRAFTRIVVQVELDGHAAANSRRPAVSQVSAGRAQRRRSGAFPRFFLKVDLEGPASPISRRPAVSQVSAGRAQRRRSLVLKANRESVRLRIRELEREVARKKLRVDRRIEEGAGGLVIVPIREPQARAV